MTETKEVKARLMKCRDAAKYLCISERTLWTLQDEGKVRAVKMGRLIRYDQADLDLFIEQCKNRGNSQLMSYKESKNV